MKRAFTLIELLVVIAIIAILAAILFPVFAQAKAAAKKTVTLSNFKQSGTAVNVYLADSDDNFPMTIGKFNATQGGVWAYNYYAPVPVGWYAPSATWGNAEGQAVASSFWANAILPYVKSSGLYEASGLVKVFIGTVTKVKEPYAVNSSMNGLLQGISSSAVAMPSKLTLFWNGSLRSNLMGRALTSPVLVCDDATSQDCRFQGSQGPQGKPTADGYGYTWWGNGANGGDDHIAQYETGSSYVATDSSARYIKITKNKLASAAGMTNDSPFSYIGDGTGNTDQGGWIIDCGAPGTTGAARGTLYPGFFRPDSEFNYTAAQCDVK